MKSAEIEKIAKQLDEIALSLTRLADQLSSKKVKFAWFCRKCKTRNVWTWDKFDYEPWTVNQLECEHCGKTTKVTKQPKQI